MEAAEHWARGGKEDNSEAIADARALGLPPEAIAHLQAQQVTADLEVMPECWPTVMAWLAVQTQWRVGPTGRAIGLDYSAVDVALRRLRIEDQDGELFAGLQTMEIAALRALQG